MLVLAHISLFGVIFIWLSNHMFMAIDISAVKQIDPKLSKLSSYIFFPMHNLDHI